jgi:uncharacterized membrane protein
MDWLSLAMRWFHVAGAVIAVGGAIFARFVVLPSMRELPEESRTGFHEAVRRRFARLVMLAIALLLISGFFNYLRNELPAHKGQSVYHALMGVKILLAFVVFFLASALVGRSPAMEGLRKSRKLVLGINVVLGMTILAIGAYLRAMPDAH